MTLLAKDSLAAWAFSASITADNRAFLIARNRSVLLHPPSPPVRATVTTLRRRSVVGDVDMHSDVDAARNCLEGLLDGGLPVNYCILTCAPMDLAVDNRQPRCGRPTLLIGRGSTFLAVVWVSDQA